jgi:hypothetical protein
LGGAGVALGFGVKRKMSEIKQDRIEVIGWSASALRELTFIGLLMRPADTIRIAAKCLRLIIRQSFYILIGR